MHDQERDSDPFDFSALGPPLRADRVDTFVATAMQRSADELARRASGGGVVRLVVAWRRPLLAASGLAAAAAIALLILPARNASGAPGAAAQASAQSGSVAEALGIPEAYAASVEGSARTGGRAEQ